MTGQLQAAEPTAPAQDPDSSPWWRALYKWNFAGLFFIVALIALWELVTDAGLVSSSTLPSPRAIIQATISLLHSGVLVRSAGHTVGAALAGWVIGAIVGLGLGVWLGMAQAVWRYSASSIEALRAIPPIAFVPALLLLAGFSFQSEVTLAAYGATFPILIYTIAGVRNYTAVHDDVAQVMHLSRFSLITKIILPSATGRIIVGMRIGMQFALALTIVSEMTGNPAGIGYQLAFQQQAINLSKLYCFVLATGLLGWLLNSALFILMRTGMPNVMRTIGEG